MALKGLNVIIVLCDFEGAKVIGIEFWQPTIEIYKERSINKLNP